jgi:hypothetical protein
MVVKCILYSLWHKIVGCFRSCLRWLQLHVKLLHSKTPSGASSNWSWSCQRVVFGCQLHLILWVAQVSLNVLYFSSSFTTVRRSHPSRAMAAWFGVELNYRGGWICDRVLRGSPPWTLTATRSGEKGLTQCRVGMETRWRTRRPTVGGAAEL